VDLEGTDLLLISYCALINYPIKNCNIVEVYISDCKKASNLVSYNVLCIILIEFFYIRGLRKMKVCLN